MIYVFESNFEKIDFTIALAKAIIFINKIYHLLVISIRKFILIIFLLISQFLLSIRISFECDNNTLNNYLDNPLYMLSNNY